MQENKSTPKTPSQAVVADDNHNHETASDATLKAAAKSLTRRQIIRDASEFVKKHISRQPPVQRFFSFMPTMLTRVSTSGPLPISVAPLTGRVTRPFSIR